MDINKVKQNCFNCRMPKGKTTRIRNDQGKRVIRELKIMIKKDFICVGRLGKPRYFGYFL